MEHFKKNRKLLLLILLLAVALYSMAQLIAAPVKDRVIQSIEVTDDVHRSEVHINFSFPVKYIKHFPLYKGKELRIQLRPLMIPLVDNDAVYGREVIVPQQTELVSLYEVVYEGDFSADGFYIHLSFNDEVVFGVEQGADFRSIVVYVCQQKYSDTLKYCLD